MNQDRCAGVWKQVRGKVKSRWGELINNPRVIAAGTRDQLTGRIQEQHAVSKEKAVRQLKDFLARNRNWNLSRRERPDYPTARFKMNGGIARPAGPRQSPR